MKKVLLADDEEEILTLLSATLEGDDRFQVILAMDGEETLRIAMEQKPDLILLDILMPVIDGYEVCQVLKSDPDMAQTKIVMLTALSQELERQKAMEVGADDYFTKPFSPTALLEKVDELLAVP